jgi:hypothetical protein
MSWKTCRRFRRGAGSCRPTTAAAGRTRRRSWREYQKARKASTAVPEADNLWRKPSAKDEIKALKAQIHELRKGGALPWGPNDSPEDQAKALFEQIGIADSERLALAVLALGKAHREDAAEDAALD